MTCSGCFPIFQDNQLGHMGPDGCLVCKDLEDYDFCPPVNLESAFDMAASKAAANEQKLVNAKECCICYELIGKTNNCVTECGHEYCLKCILFSTRNNNSCPYCRHELIPEEVFEDDESYEEEESAADDDESDTEQEIEETEEQIAERVAWEINHEAPVEEIVQRFERAGITMQDVISLMIGRYSRNDSKYTKEYIKQMESSAHYIVFYADRERMEMTAMARQDVQA